ncbi:hypothetical protein [Fibrobacter intestinalis]|uniref:hypothetical protein n=1 Tax=Fibrobacter sp. NR9 TaxID=1896200 RepID=UPI000BB0E954|nr:hypothetical protein [Fibrobacter sp. NR9]PBC73070.1 hypothetical protein BGW94_0659 [Fibrobacter sp. NR9]
MKSLSTVQLPVARFLGEVLSRNDKELVIWVKAFAEALAYYNPAMNDFAAELIADVENFRAKDAERKRPRKTQSTTAAGESAEKLDPPDIGGSAASATQVAAARAGGVGAPPKVSAKSPAEGCATGKRIPPPSTAELYDFAEAARLSDADAREWWELCTERGWKDRSGKPIRDWKKACERYCARRAINRMAKGET